MLTTKILCQWQKINSCHLTASRLWAKKNYEEPKVPNHEILGAQYLTYMKKVSLSTCSKAVGSPCGTQAFPEDCLEGAEKNNKLCRNFNG